MDETVEAATQLLEDRRQGPGSFELDPIQNPHDMVEAEERFAAAYRAIRDGHAALAKQKLSRLFGGFWPVLLFFVGAALIAAPLILFVNPAGLKIPALADRNTWLLSVVGGAAVLMMVFLAILYGIALQEQRRLSRRAAGVRRVEGGAEAMAGDCQGRKLAERKQQFERRYAEIVAQRDRALANVEATAAKRLNDATVRKERERSEADQKYPALLKEIAEQRDLQLEALDRDFQQKMTELSTAKRETAEKASRSANGAGARAAETTARTAMAEKWRSGTSKFFGAVAGFEKECGRAAIDWSAMSNGGWTLPDQVLRPIRVGHYDFDFAKIPNGLPRDPALMPEPPRIRLPLALPFPSPRGSLLLECRAEGRAVAVEAIRTIMLRLLTSLPGGKLRFTVIDPVGLGQELPAFMHLADYDELIIGTKIWTEKPQIEKRLTDLSGAHGERLSGLSPQRIRHHRGIQRAGRGSGRALTMFLVVANFRPTFPIRRPSGSSASRPADRDAASTPSSASTRNSPCRTNFDLADLEAVGPDARMAAGPLSRTIPIGPVSREDGCAAAYGRIHGNL